MPTLKATGIGASPVNLVLTPTTTTYRAPSGKGKTSALRAWLLLMVGRDEAGKPLDSAYLSGDWSVELEYPGRDPLVLHLDAKVRRWGEMTCKTMARWQEQPTNWRATDPSRVLLVAAPHADRMAWYQNLSPVELRDLLVASTSDVALDGGKPTLARATADLCASVVKGSEHWQAGDPTDPATINERRKDADRVAAADEGVLSEARRQLADAAEPEPLDLGKARAIVAAADEWAAHLRSRETWDAGRTLGDRPPKASAEEIEGARDLLQVKIQGMEEAAASEAGALLLLTQAKAWTPPADPDDLVDLRSRARLASEALKAPMKALEGACLTCEHGGLAQEATRKRLAEEREAAIAAGQKRAGEWSAEVAGLKANADRIKGEADVAYRTAKDLTYRREATVHEAREKLRTLEDQHNAWELWGERRGRLIAESGHTEPVWSAIVAGPRPEPPTSEQPSPKTEEAARRALAAADRADAIAEERAKARAKAATRIEEAEVKLAASRAKAARLRSLHEVATRAPSDLLPRVLAEIEATGLLGDHVSLVPADGGVVARWDGRPWHTASNGERTYADACLRAAIRRVLGMEGIHLWIDDAQDWSGDWPQVARVVLAVTG